LNTDMGKFESSLKQSPVTWFLESL